MERSQPKDRKHSADSALSVNFAQEKESSLVVPSRSLLSSQPGQWSGIHLAYYQHAPGEIARTVSKQHLVLIHLEGATQVEQRLGTQLEKHYFRAGSVLLIPAHTRHAARWDAKHRYLLLSIDPDVLLKTQELTDKKQSTELIPRFTDADPLVHGIGLALKSELELDSVGNQLYVDSLHTTLFTHVLRHYSAQRSVFYDREDGLPYYRFQQVAHYIDTYLDRNLTLAELSAIAQLSPNYFTHLFKQSTGMTPHQYVIRQRVERAKRLLLEENLSIADVAIQVGFAHQSHLNRHFKRHTGVTPKAFINKQ